MEHLKITNRMLQYWVDDLKENKYRRPSDYLFIKIRPNGKVNIEVRCRHYKFVRAIKETMDYFLEGEFSDSEVKKKAPLKTRYYIMGIGSKGLFRINRGLKVYEVYHHLAKSLKSIKKEPLEIDINKYVVEDR